MQPDLLDRLAIRQLVDDWAVYSDAGDWDRFREVWHDDGHMMATWTQGNADYFVGMRKKAFESGAMGILHFHGGHTSDIKGDRAIAQTKMQILQRGPIEGIMVDVICTGRFYDFIERRDGRWGFVHRQPIYEKDCITAVDPGEHHKLKLEPELLNSFPEGYRNLAYLQVKIGFPVKKNMPGLKGDEVDKLYAKGKAWLDGVKGHPKEF